MGAEKRNEAARFVTLIDALYEHKREAAGRGRRRAGRTLPHGDGTFEFQRTVSRLEEMQSAGYLAEGHGAA